MTTNEQTYKASAAYTYVEVKDILEAFKQLCGSTEAASQSFKSLGGSVVTNNTGSAADYQAPSLTVDPNSTGILSSTPSSTGWWAAYPGVGGVINVPGASWAATPRLVQIDLSKLACPVCGAPTTMQATNATMALIQAPNQDAFEVKCNQCGLTGGWNLSPEQALIEFLSAAGSDYKGRLYEIQRDLALRLISWIINLMAQGLERGQDHTQEALKMLVELREALQRPPEVKA